MLALRRKIAPLSVPLDSVDRSLPVNMG